MIDNNSAEVVCKQLREMVQKFEKGLKDDETTVVRFLELPNANPMCLTDLEYIEPNSICFHGEYHGKAIAIVLPCSKVTVSFLAEQVTSPNHAHRLSKPDCDK